MRSRALLICSRRHVALWRFAPVQLRPQPRRLPAPSAGSGLPGAPRVARAPGHATLPAAGSAESRGLTRPTRAAPPGAAQPPAVAQRHGGACPAVRRLHRRAQRPLAVQPGAHVQECAVRSLPRLQRYAVRAVPRLLRLLLLAVRLLLPRVVLLYTSVRRRAALPLHALFMRLFCLRPLLPLPLLLRPLQLLPGGRRGHAVRHASSVGAGTAGHQEPAACGFLSAHGTHIRPQYCNTRSLAAVLTCCAAWRRRTNASSSHRQPHKKLAFPTRCFVAPTPA